MRDGVYCVRLLAVRLWEREAQAFENELAQEVVLWLAQEHLL